MLNVAVRVTEVFHTRRKSSQLVDRPILCDVGHLIRFHRPMFSLEFCGRNTPGRHGSVIMMVWSHCQNSGSFANGSRRTPRDDIVPIILAGIATISLFFIVRQMGPSDNEYLNSEGLDESQTKGFGDDKLPIYIGVRMTALLKSVYYIKISIAP